MIRVVLLLLLLTALVADSAPSPQLLEDASFKHGCAVDCAKQHPPAGSQKYKRCYDDCIGPYR